MSVTSTITCLKFMTHLPDFELHHAGTELPPTEKGSQLDINVKKDYAGRMPKL